MARPTSIVIPFDQVAAPAVRGDLDAVLVDLDNTLVKGSALFHLGRGLVASGIVDRAQLARAAGSQLLFTLLGESPRLVSAARRRALHTASGLPVTTILDRIDEMCERYVLPQCWPGTVRLLAAHRAHGTPVWLATAAPVALAAAVARQLGLDGALGTEVECRDGRFTGRLAGPLVHGPAKAEAVARLAARRGWDLGACGAYSDSTADLPLLMAVGHPCVVNPDRALAQIAALRGWSVRDFRGRHLSRHVTQHLRADPSRAHRRGARHHLFAVHQVVVQP